MSDHELSNPHNYVLDALGQPVCQLCLHTTSAGYRETPDLQCWKCGARKFERPTIRGIRVYERGIAQLELENKKLAEEVELLRAAITKHHSQKSDDRCVLDDDELYAAAGLPLVDRRVGDKAAMLENCRRFIERRCEAGGWKSYVELERELEEVKQQLQGLQS